MLSFCMLSSYEAYTTIEMHQHFSSLLTYIYIYIHYMYKDQHIVFNAKNTGGEKYIYIYVKLTYSFELSTLWIGLNLLKRNVGVWASEKPCTRVSEWKKRRSWFCFVSLCFQFLLLLLFRLVKLTDLLGKWRPQLCNLISLIPHLSGQ